MENRLYRGTVQCSGNGCPGLLLYPVRHTLKANVPAITGDWLPLVPAAAAAPVAKSGGRCSSFDRPDYDADRPGATSQRNVPSSHKIPNRRSSPYPRLFFESISADFPRDNEIKPFKGKVHHRCTLLTVL